MARVVKNTDAQQIVCDVITTFTDGSTSSRSLKIGEVVEGLRYIENETVKTVTGKITRINVFIEKVTKVNVNAVEDYFGKDVTVRSIVIDASEQYESKLVSVNPREIVEDEGVLDVARVDVKCRPIVTMDIEYTDGTIANQELEIGDVLTDVVIMSGTPGTDDITGDFRVKAFNYTALNGTPKIIGAYLVPLVGGTAVLAPFKNFIKFEEKAHADIDDPKTFISDLYAALESAEDGVAYAQLSVDVEIPKRDDGKITAIFVEEGQTLNMDLNGHDLDCQAYAFYVAGGTLNISDTTGKGAIKTHIKNVAYPAVMCLSGGTINMDSGIIDTTNAVLEGEDYNWTYGVVCSGDGVFNMTGGKIKTAAASGISITNGTASGEGAQFIIGGDSVLESESCAAIYLADNKRVIIKDNARIKGGIVARMGDIQILDHAVVEAPDVDKVEPLGEQVMLSGVCAPAAAFLALTGIYKSALGNDMNVFVAKTAKLTGYVDHALDIATINTKYDQKVDVIVENSNSLVSPTKTSWHVYNHAELAEIVTRDTGKTLAAETTTTDLKITVNGEVVYPVVDETPAEEVTEG